jgi:hypothetical protein
MIRVLMAALVAIAIFASQSDTHAMSSRGKHRNHAGGEGESVTTFSFQEYSSRPASSVPEAGTILLLVSGVAGLALWARRRK